jgi:hypothetical protein
MPAVDDSIFVNLTAGGFLKFLSCGRSVDPKMFADSFVWRDAFTAAATTSREIQYGQGLGSWNSKGTPAS